MLEWNVAYAEPPGMPSGRALIEELDRKGIAGEKREEAFTDYLQRNLRYVLVERTLKNAIDFAGPREGLVVGPRELRPRGAKSLVLDGA